LFMILGTLSRTFCPYTTLFRSRQVIEGRNVTEVASLPPFAGMPGCTLGRIDMPDGLVIYVLLCADLFDRDGTPYADADGADWSEDRKSTRLNSSHVKISYAVFC